MIPTSHFCCDQRSEGPDDPYQRVGRSRLSCLPLAITTPSDNRQPSPPAAPPITGGFASVYQLVAATGRTWAVNVSRVVPGLGVQAWSGPADGEPRPEGMGLLQFRAER